MPKLFFDIEARFASVQDALTKIDRDVNKFGSSIKGAFAGLGSVLGVGLLTSFAESMVASASALDDMAEATGATVEGLSKLTDIARISGQDIGAVETALVKLTRALSGTDDETKGAGAALNAIGLSFAQLQALSPDKALEEVAKALANFSDGAGKTSAALAIFGRTGAQLLPLLKDIGDEIDRTGSLTAQQAADAEQLEKSWGRMRVEAQNLARTLLTDLIPAFESFTTGAARGGIGGAINAALATFGKDTAEAIKETRRQIAEQEKAINEPGSMLGGGLLGAAAGVRLAALQRQLEALKGRQIAEARRIATQMSIDAASGLPQLPFIPSETSTRGKSGGGIGEQTRAGLAQLEGALKTQAQNYKGYYDTVDSLRRQNAIGERESISMLSAAHLAELEDRRKVLESQAGLVAGHSAEYERYGAKVAEVDAEIIATHARYANDFLEIEARIEEARRDSINAAIGEMVGLQDQLQAARDAAEEVSVRAAAGAGAFGSEARAAAEEQAVAALRASRLERIADLREEAAATLDAFGADELLTESYRGQAQALRDTAEQIRKAGSLQGLVDQNKSQLAELEAAINGWSKSATQAFVDFAFGAETSIGDMLTNIAKQFAGMQIQKSVMDPLFGAFGTMLKGVLPFHSGGIVGMDGGSGRSVSGLAFAGAPRLHGGFLPDEYPAILKRGEGVFTPNQMRAMGSGNIRVELKNEGTPQQVTRATPTFDPAGMVISIVTRDLANNGPISQTMGQTFGVRR